ncbi:MAG: CDP-glycerol glycerophosphotransferase family protein [Emergencia sp.]|nr:CDP-glycerol glycerophosphotransferase family protein [Emergencia sp.]
MKIISILKNIAKKSTPLRILMRSTLYGTRKVVYRSRGLFAKPDEKTIVFGAYNGKSYACSPKAVYEYMLSDPRFSDYQFIWLFDHPEKYKYLEKNRHTGVVKNQSAECEKYLHEAKYWIFNFRALDHWVPGKGQVYVQCWHGTPLKRLGYDITVSDNAMNSVREIRDKYRTDTARLDYLLSPCRFVTEKFSSAWNLKAFGKEKAILEIGYPRNDFLNTFTEEDVKVVKERLGLSGIDKKIILYAPTWRDNQHDAQAGYVYENPVDFDFLKKQLGDAYIILFRAHYLVADNFDFRAYEGFIYDVSAYDDINELYIAADLLITDYSSVFFDYAILERPMLFYMYDMEEYRDEMRGFYLDTADLPGEIVKTEEELVAAIDAIDFQKAASQVKEFNQEYNLLNDGKASARLADIILKNAEV